MLALVYHLQVNLSDFTSARSAAAPVASKATLSVTPDTDELKSLSEANNRQFFNLVGLGDRTHEDVKLTKQARSESWDI